MIIKPLHSPADHAAALATIERLWNAEAGSRDADVLEVLATLVEAYEREHTPVLPPDPIEAIKFRLEQQGVPRSMT
jgi:HTH-type transcriptional regulator/antitoxin HigA